MASRKEWTENARSCAQRAAWAITEARQALIDARRAATFAGEADWVAYVQKAIDASESMPQLLNDTINVMDGGEPWYAKGKLNPPKDMDSAGEGESDPEPIAEADAAERFSEACARQKREREVKP